ncbi:hypothetical protein CYLTODRAFT_411679 [Cylindrobasidium torrendii FP15055 ss-10]|uniref:Uncharacterized protein n=1 Tax=Cylindrobasidium torrendii FP15055 ss-10 TaxID=1314674 RepID=A0A0D7BAZ7_9AGAR|nr:hypothetical protein CYLTODRAFT_411679 [Cylindrobasidium torrendii FP15055 ss-10]
MSSSPNVVPAAPYPGYTQIVLDYDSDNAGTKNVVEKAREYYGELAVKTNFNSVYMRLFVECPRCNEKLFVEDFREHLIYHESENPESEELKAPLDGVKEQDSEAPAQYSPTEFGCMRCSNPLVDAGISTLEELISHAARWHVYEQYKCVFCWESLGSQNKVMDHYFPPGGGGGCIKLEGRCVASK